MTHLRIHLVYLALFGFLAYLYWTKTQALNEAVGSIEQFDKLLKTNIEVVGFESNRLLNELRVVSIAYPNTLNLSYFKKAQNVVSKESSISNWLNTQNQFLKMRVKKILFPFLGNRRI